MDVVLCRHHMRWIVSVFVGVIISALATLFKQVHQSTRKIPYHTSIYTGEDWVLELLTGHPRRIRTELRVSHVVFDKLIDTLHSMGFTAPYKGTSIRFLTSPILPYPPLFICTSTTPWYHLQEPHSKADDLRTHSPTTLQKLTPGCCRLPASPPARTLAASDEPWMHWDRSAWHYGTVRHHMDTYLWEAWW
jgi:hypothetical protein